MITQPSDSPAGPDLTPAGYPPDRTMLYPGAESPGGPSQSEDAIPGTGPRPESPAAPGEAAAAGEQGEADERPDRDPASPASLPPMISKFSPDVQHRPYLVDYAAPLGSWPSPGELRTQAIRELSATQLREAMYVIAGYDYRVVDAALGHLDKQAGRLQQFLDEEPEDPRRRWWQRKTHGRHHRPGT